MFHFILWNYILWKLCNFPIVGSRKQDRRLVHLTPPPPTTFFPSFPLQNHWSTQSWALDNTSSVRWWNTGETQTSTYVIVGWFLFIQSSNKEKLCYIMCNNKAAFTFISVHKIIQWSGLLLYWEKIHLSNSVYRWYGSVCCNFSVSCK
jgi:hypothetical protein